MDIMPLIVQDMQSSILFEYNKKDNIYCIGSGSVNKYFFVKEKYLETYMKIIRQMNGKQTLGQIKEKLNAECPEEIIDGVYNTCLKCNMIVNEKSSNNNKFDELKATYKDVLTINISRFCEMSNRINNGVYFIIGCIMVLVILLSLFSIGSTTPLIPWGFVTGDLRTLVYSVFISSVSVFAHEISHAVVASKLGLQIKTAQIATFTYFTFACYIKLPGIYFLKPIKRILIWSVGIFTNIFFIASSVLAFKFVGSQGQLFLSMVIICNISIVFSAIVPFYISDGYFILSTFCKAPNLRKDVFMNIASFFKTGKLQFVSFVYLLYFVITVVFTIGVVGFVVVPVLINIFNLISAGTSFKGIFIQYINIFIVIIVLFLSKITRAIGKKINRGE